MALRVYGTVAYFVESMGSSTIIVGGGLSGTLVAIQLLRRLGHGDRITVVERSGVCGRGIAYGTENPDHLLNVPAMGMTAFPDTPDDFVKWWSARTERPESEIRTNFAPRMVYAEYIAERLERAIEESEAEFQLAAGTAVAVSKEGDRFTVSLEDGASIEGTSLILTLGNQTPASPGPLGALAGSEVYQPNPWKADALAGLKAEDDVLLVGTGLTMVDAVISLVGAGHKGRIWAVSRRGLLPRRHMIGTPPQGLDLTETPRTARALAHAIIASARTTVEAGGNWRSVIDGLRADTPRIWGEMPWNERKRFLSRLTPYWDVHRHRIAPEIADLLESAIEQGQLQAVPAHVVGASVADGRATVTLNLRTGGTQTLTVDRIVNCTGPDTNLRRSQVPVLESLVAQGFAEYDALGLGLQVTGDGKAGVGGLYAVGPVCRGCRWETTAAPEIRVQAQAVAQAIAAP